MPDIYDVYVYMNACGHVFYMYVIHIHFCLLLNLFMYIDNHDFTQVFPILVYHPKDPFWFLPFLSVTALPQ